MRAARRARNLTQDQLAELIQTSQSTVARIEHAETMPPADVATRIAAALGITIDELLVVDESESHARPRRASAEAA